VISREVPQVGDGELKVVSSIAAAPADGDQVLTVAVSVEGGLGADGPAFADFVVNTLNDPRGWPHEGYAFASADSASAADVTVVLASPDTSAAMCRPLETFGKLSCRNGGRVVLTWYRWVGGIEGYGTDLNAYRRYLVNHEIGHVLGKGHVSCPGAGSVAPVMMQQTLGLDGCLPNSWPHP